MIVCDTGGKASLRELPALTLDDLLGCSTGWKNQKYVLCSTVCVNKEGCRGNCIHIYCVNHGHIGKATWEADEIVSRARSWVAGERGVRETVQSSAPTLHCGSWSPWACYLSWKSRSRGTVWKFLNSSSHTPLPEPTESCLRLLRTVPLSSPHLLALGCQPHGVPSHPSSPPHLSAGPSHGLGAHLHFPPSCSSTQRCSVFPGFCLEFHLHFCPVRSLKIDIHLSHPWVMKGLVSGRRTRGLLRASRIQLSNRSDDTLPSSPGGCSHSQQSLPERHPSDDSTQYTGGSFKCILLNISLCVRKYKTRPWILWDFNFTGIIAQTSLS